MKKSLFISCIFLSIGLQAQIQFSESFYEYSANDISFVNEVATGFLNGDDSPDIVLIHYASRTIYTGINNNLQEPNFSSFDSEAAIYYAKVYDLDGDGDGDIIGSAIFEDKAYWYEKVGFTGYERRDFLSLDYQSLEIADLNMDGIDEFILGVDNKLRIYHWENNQLQLFTTIEDSNQFSSNPIGIEVYDNNGDGNLDIAASYNSEGITVFEQVGTSLDFNEVDKLLGSSARELSVDDINGDGLTDFILFDNQDRRTSTLMQNSDGSYDLANINSVLGDNIYSAFGDFDSDGDEDIVFVDNISQTEGEISILVNNDGVFTKQLLTDLYSNTQFIEIIDLDNDGDLDICLYSHYAFGKGLVYYINNTLVDQDQDGFTSDIDCDDNNPQINPDATEVCDELDNNCDGVIDEGVENTYYADLDDDGFGNPDIITMACTAPINNVENGDDCNDSDPEINPDAVDIPNNGIDENCDGMDATSGVEDILYSKIRIYPNPTSDYINIVSDLYLLDYEIRDALGKRVASGNYNSRISTSSIPSGKYILLLRNDDGLMLRKMFVKQ